MPHLLYTATKDVAPIDWLARLEAPVITGSEWALYANESLSWVTCACGNQCDALPRNEDGMPVDGRLMHLGCKFDKHVRRRKPAKAIKTLHKIEARSIELLTEMGLLLPDVTPEQPADAR